MNAGSVRPIAGVLRTEAGVHLCITVISRPALRALTNVRVRQVRAASVNARSGHAVVDVRGAIFIGKPGRAAAGVRVHTIRAA